MYSLTAIITLLFFPEKQKVLMLIYGWFRKIDDIVDGDEDVPAGYNIDSYLAQKQSVMNGNNSLLLPEDILFLYSSQFFAKQEIDMRQEMKNLFSAMVREHRWRGRFIERKELSENMALQDKAVLMMIIKASDANVEFYERHLFGFLGIFTKIDSLVDIHEDARKGIINIPLEDAVERGFDVKKIVSVENLRDIPGFNDWYKKEVRESLEKWSTVRKLLRGRPEMFLLNLILNTTKIEIRV